MYLKNWWSISSVVRKLISGNEQLLKEGGQYVFEKSS